MNQFSVVLMNENTITEKRIEDNQKLLTLFQTNIQNFLTYSMLYIKNKDTVKMTELFYLLLKNITFKSKYIKIGIRISLPSSYMNIK